MPDAARRDDNHACPNPTPRPHVGGPITVTSNNVDTNSKGQARATDRMRCTGVPTVNFIVTGSKTVEINGLMAARKTDKTMHPGPGSITHAVITPIAAIRYIARARILDLPLIGSGPMMRSSCTRRYPGTRRRLSAVGHGRGGEEHLRWSQAAAPRRIVLGSRGQDPRRRCPSTPILSQVESM